MDLFLGIWLERKNLIINSYDKGIFVSNLTVCNQARGPKIPIFYRDL